MMNKDLILILTQKDDQHADQVIEELRCRQHDFLRFDTASFPMHATLKAAHESNGWQGGIHVQDQFIDFERIKSIWFRRPTRFQVHPLLDSRQAHFAENEARMAVGGLLRSLDCLWVNHPERQVSASYKPYQLQVAHSCELLIPPTLITNDPLAVEQFFRRYQSIVYKALSGTTIEREGEFANIYTTLIDEEKLQSILPSVKNTACLFQQTIPKQADIRVTIIGEQIFST